MEADKELLCRYCKEIVTDPVYLLTSGLKWKQPCHEECRQRAIRLEAKAAVNCWTVRDSSEKDEEY